MKYSIINITAYSIIFLMLNTLGVDWNVYQYWVIGLCGLALNLSGAHEGISVRNGD